ncbi:MAG: MFS transporter [Anaerolineae bacterium]|nr:MFS transporter [Anaerolineae bacterium]
MSEVEVSSDIAIRHLRRNFILGVVNGAFFQFSNAIISPCLVLPLFVRYLTGSHLLVGLVPSIQDAGWFLPQLVASRYIQQRPQKMVYYGVTAIIRIGSWGLLTLALFTLGGNRPLLLGIFVSLLVVSSFASGVGGIPFLDIVGKTIPVTRRGSFFGGRNFFGGILAFAGGFIIKYALDQSGYPFPINFGFLFTLSFLALSVSLFLFTQVVEPVGPVHEGEVALLQQFGRALKIVEKDSRYRRFLFLRLCLMATQMATPFYILYARERLGIPGGMVGLYLSGMTLVSVGSNLIWSRISDRQSNKLLLQIASILGLSVPLSALFIPHLSGLLSPKNLGYLFSVVFLLLGSYSAGVEIGNMNFLLEISPAAERPIYFGFINTILGMALVASAVGGVIVEVAGSDVLFSLTLAFYALAIGFSLALRDPREEIDGY